MINQIIEINNIIDASLENNVIAVLTSEVYFVCYSKVFIPAHVITYSIRRITARYIYENCI